jgi:hypothetical protein
VTPTTVNAAVTTVGSGASVTTVPGSPTTAALASGSTGTVAGSEAGSTTTAAAVSAGVTLSGSTPGDAQTGGQELLLAIAGLGVAGASEVARRRFRSARH